MAVKRSFDKLIFFEGIERTATKLTSLFSQLCHFIAFRLKEPKIQLENGMFIISIDVDVGSKELGVINKGKNDANVSSHISEYSVGEIEERALPLIINFFNDCEIPATFAIRGQLAEVDNSILVLLLKSPVKHDIGSHGYYHRAFKNLSQNEAEKELHMTSATMKKFGITPRSFVFPRNSIAHLDLLEKYGYKCYRGHSSGSFLSDGMYVKKCGQLYDIHPSLFIGVGVNPVFAKRIIDVSCKRKLPCHFWFHPWNFGETKESIQRSISKWLFPLFEYAKKKVKSGTLTFETMLSVAEKVEKRLDL